jgi:hypothetical protein
MKTAAYRISEEEDATAFGRVLARLTADSNNFRAGPLVKTSGCDVFVFNYGLNKGTVYLVDIPKTPYGVLLVSAEDDDAFRKVRSLLEEKVGRKLDDCEEVKL